MLQRGKDVVVNIERLPGAPVRLLRTPGRGGGGINLENCSLFVLFAGQKPNGSIKGAIKHQEVAGAPKKNLLRLLLEMRF